MKATKRLIGILLAACLCLALAAPVSASQITDAHGNVIELGDKEGYAEVALPGAEDAARKGETALGDLWTDALRWFVVSGKIDGYYEEDDVKAGNNSLAVDADHVVALWNGGNLRDDVPAGRFDEEQLVKVLPYPNKVAVVYMTGAQLREALEAASQGLPYTEDSAAACASFMQVAGMKYTLDLEKPFDKGEEYKAPWFRAASVGRVTIGEVNGQAYDESALYAVVTSNANFNGMDSSYVFKEAAAADTRCVITTAVVRDVVWLYLAEALENVVKEADYGKPQGRVTLLTKPAVVLSPQKLKVNGEEKKTEIYNIDGANYFRLRDVAALLSGTGSQFSVAYDAEANAVVLKTGEAYEKQPGDLELGEDKSASAVRSTQSILLDGAAVTDLTAFNLGGSNFFKLRELGEKLGFGVDYDAETNTVLVTGK